MNLRLNLRLNRRWTPRQTLKILECINALYDTIWEVHKDEIHFYLENQQERTRTRKSRPISEHRPAATSNHDCNEDDLLF